MTATSDVDTLLDPLAAARAKALRVRGASDIRLPDLKFWEPRNPEHQLKRHQRVGVSWMYLNQSGILADTMGLGKTIQAIALLCLMKEKGDLTDRALIVMRPAALLQWKEEFDKFAPRIQVEVAIGDLSRRVQAYCSNFDVTLIGYQMFLRDADRLARLDLGTIITDDVDPIRNEDNQTSLAIRRLTRYANRAYVMSGTPLQTRIEELYNLLSVVGGTADLGTRQQFDRRYVRRERISEYDPSTGKKKVKNKVVGYKNMAEFRDKVTPWYLRRTHKDLDNGDMPDVAPPDNVWLDLYPPQREAYDELQRDVVKIVTAEGEKVKHATAWAKLHYAAQITAGMGTLGFDDIEGESSVKLDWLGDKLTGDLADEKVIIFAQYKPTIRLMQERFKRMRLKHITFWGEEADPHHRQSIQHQFWEDPKTRICIGTSAMEQSLNLQVARILVNIDMLLNPARMAQIAGRNRRMGSPHKTVYIFNLLCRGTHEERSLPVLERRQALSDYVFGERSELFEQLSPMALMELIKP